MFTEAPATCQNTFLGTAPPVRSTLEVAAVVSDPAQELIASLLGVRRESITQVAGKLQKDGLIEYARGRIIVIDRPKLEDRACECYSDVKKEYQRLLPQR